MSDSNGEHPTATQLRDFLMGRLSGDAHERTEDHIRSCRQCTEVLESVQTEDDPLLASLRDAVKESASRDRTGNSGMPRKLEGPSVGRDDPSDLAGTRIGPYKLLQPIGEGGMGIVYMCDQEHPVKRRVAMKIIKPGMDSKQVVARFEAERQAFAMMDHMSIAKVFDAGMTDNGLPYFVMELVRGRHITEYCDHHRLTVRERLELFVPVCHAIQHAHQKGIIHRDIKPANVLVCLYDGKPVPKIIDFGVAKALEQRLTDRTMFTRFGQVIGTLEYMSPEQAELSQIDVDTRSDIYSLGVLLYELLTGTTPLDQHRLTQTVFTESLRLIREEEPAKPSARLSSSTEILPAISEQRSTKPERLGAILRGDLDWIVMKALEKDRNRRYETASALARDIERYLRDEPIEARPPSTFYRIQKFTRKNRGLVLSVTMFVALLTLAAVVSGFFAIQASHRARDADRARETAEELRRKAEAANRVASRERNRARQQSADLLLERGLELADEGRISEALHWMVASLKTSSDPDHQRIVRTHLASWSARIPTLVSWLDTRHSVGAFSRDAQQFLTAGRVGPRSKHVRLQYWDVRSGIALGLAINTDDPGVGSVAYHPHEDAILLASGWEQDAQGFPGWVSDWDFWKRARSRKFKGHSNCVVAADWAPDGTRLVSSSFDGTVWLWDRDSGKTVWKSAPAPAKVMSVAFAPSGAWIAGVSGDSIFILDATTGEFIGKPFQPASDGSSLRGISWSPDGRLLIAFSERASTVVEWQAAERKLVRIAGYEPVGEAPKSFLADGRMVTLAKQVISPDGTMYYQRNDGLQIWRRPRTNSSEAMFAPVPRTRTAVQVDFMRTTSCPDGSRVFLVASVPRMVRCFGWNNGRPVGVPVLHQARWGTPRLAVSHRGDRIAAVASGYQPGHLAPVIVWDVDTGNIVGKPIPQRNSAQALAFSPDDKLLAVGGHDHTVRIWDLATGKQVGKALHQQDMVLDLAFSPDGTKLVAGTWSREARLWDLATRREIVPPLRHNEPVQAITFSPDGTKILAMCSRTGFHVWDAHSGKKLGTLAFSAPVTAGRVLKDPQQIFSPNGRTVLISSGYSSFQLWDLPTLKPLGPPTPIGKLQSSCFTFSPDSRYVAAGHEDGTVQVWDVAASKPLGATLYQPVGVCGVRFTQDGRNLKTIAADGTIRSWPLPRPLEGDVGRLTRAVELATAMRYDEQAGVVRLTRDEFERRRARWQADYGSAPWQLVPHMNRHRWYQVRAREAEQAGRTFTARWHLDQLLANHKDHRTLHARKGRSFAQDHQWSAAKEAYRLAAEEVPTDQMRAWYWDCAIQFAQEANWPAARWHQDLLAKMNPDQWQPLVARAWTCRKTGDDAGFRADITRARELGAPPGLLAGLAESDRKPETEDQFRHRQD